MCAYQATYADMLGYACPCRCKRDRHDATKLDEAGGRFCKLFGCDDRVEFGDGDLGLRAAPRSLKASSLNITTVVLIRRFGGPTSTAAQGWRKRMRATTK